MEMALRIETGIGSVLMLVLLPAAWGEDVEARHRHLRKSGSGVLSIGAEGVAFRESGKRKTHSREWKYEDIQQLTLGGGGMRVLTYEDVGWQLRRDREFRFEGLPEGFAARVRGTLAARLGSRLVTAAALPDDAPLWRLPVKLERRYGGSQGVLTVAAGHVAYRTESPDDSRTWPIGDIENVSSSGPYNLTITTAERFAWHRGGGREARFQLKEPLGEERYDQLWKAVQRAKGLNIAGR
jgi:hypothetical protein